MAPLARVVLGGLLALSAGTEERCHRDCAAADRRPTRPWDATDPLRTPLRLTRPYPYHLGAVDDDGRYDLPEFCQLGCTYFFVSSDAATGAGGGARAPTTLGRCVEQCDEKYSYNSSTRPGYNDLAEMARLECRDGCLLALQRCQPGYYCSQVSFDEAAKAANILTAGSVQYSGGDMLPCPAGTYRDVSYGAVTECTPCPPNHFREDIKGRSLSSCAPCRAGTSAVDAGSTSVKDCVRCPAGTFSTEASFCMCITPQACAEDQLPSPADAEKKDTVPFAGRW